MDTGQLLDLFTVEKEKKKEKSMAHQNDTGKASLKTMMENLGELWDEEQYETEYNLDNFIESLKWLLQIVGHFLVGVYCQSYNDVTRKIEMKVLWKSLLQG